MPLRDSVCVGKEINKQIFTAQRLILYRKSSVMNLHMVGEVTNYLKLMHKSDARHGPWITRRRQFESELEPEMLTCTKAETGLRSGKWFLES